MRAAHEKGGQIKDSVVDRIDNTIIRVGEPIEAAKNLVVTKTKESYKNLEGRAVSSYESFRTRIDQARESAKNKWEVLKQQRAMQEFIKAQINVDRAMEMFNRAAEAAGQSARYKKEGGYNIEEFEQAA